MKRADSAQRVWNVLVENLDEEFSLDREEIATRAGLTYTQVTYALGFVRDFTMESERRELVCMWQNGRWCYWLPEDWHDWAAYVDLRFRTLYTQVKRLESGAHAAGDHHGRRIKQLRLTERTITRLREDLEEALAIAP